MIFTIIMRITSLAFSLLLLAAPAVISAQDSSNDTLPSIEDYLLPSVLHNNPDVSIYYSALVSTGLLDTLKQYIDPTYPGVEYDSTLRCFFETGRVIRYQTAYETENGIFPDQRQFRYTLFVIPDSILRADYNITSLNDLRSYAENEYPQGAGKPDQSRESSLNMFMSYHILPMGLSWDQLNTAQLDILVHRHHLDELDVEDFYETMLPHSIMRISTPYKEESYSRASQITRDERYGIFINRKGTVKDPANLIEGIQILNTYDYGVFENSAINGYYHYITEPLAYNEATRSALNVRMRIMASTLSPDFINSGARGRLRVSEMDRYVVGFLPGYCKNFKWSMGSELWVRYRDASFGCYNGDETTLRGPYDISFRLPSVPQDGLYEIRIPVYIPNVDNIRSASGNVLYYIRQEGGDFLPCGKPADLTIATSDPRIGYVRDDDVDIYDIIRNNPDLTESEARELAIAENDKLLRKNGYMKSPDSYGPYNGSMRNDQGFLRKIVCEMYMEADKDYYLRIRQVGPDGFGTTAFNYIEIVPYNVYSGENGPEDWH